MLNIKALGPVITNVMADIKVFVFFTNTGTSLFVITGKTTLADALVASNGIISQRMAGKVTETCIYNKG